jgi:hypothetical protein
VSARGVVSTDVTATTPIRLVTREQTRAVRDNSTALLIGLCTVAALLRLLLAYYFVSHYGAERVYRGFESCQIAASIVAGHGFSSPYGIPSGPTAWLPPAYPYLVAAVFKIFGVYSLASLWVLILVNIVCETLVVAALFRVGLRCFGPMTAFAGSVLWAIELGAASYSVRIWESSLSALLATLAVVVYLRLKDSPAKVSVWIGYGLLWGVMGLTNTTLLTLMPLAVGALLLQKGRRVWRPALAGLAIFLCTLTPWTIRNYVVFHKLIPIRGNFGPNLWYGNHPGVEGPADQSLNPTRNSSELQAYLQMGDAAYGKSRQQMALGFIAQHPGQFLGLTWSRMLYFWMASEALGSKWRAGISILAFLGLLLMYRDHSSAIAPFASALLLFPLPYYVTHAEAFYRHPIEPVVGLLAVYTCVTLMEIARGLVASRTVAGIPRMRTA